jgi:hypothetical protein
MITAFSRPSADTRCLQCKALVLASDDMVGLAGRPAISTNTARMSPRYEGKTDDATAVIELPMMGGKTPETC